MLAWCRKCHKDREVVDTGEFIEDNEFFCKTCQTKMLSSDLTQALLDEVTSLRSDLDALKNTVKGLKPTVKSTPQMKKYWVEFDKRHMYFIGQICIATLYNNGQWYCAWNGFPDTCLNGGLNKDITHKFYDDADLPKLKKLCEVEMDRFLKNLSIQKQVKF